MATTKATKSKTGKPANRRGVTAVEFAFVAPFIFFLFFGFWEWSRVEMIRQTSTTACFEAARRGTLPSATPAQMSQVADRVLSTYTVQNYIFSSSIDTAGRQSTATVTVPLDDNLATGSLLFQGKSLTTTYSLELETNPD